MPAIEANREQTGQGPSWAPLGAITGAISGEGDSAEKGQIIVTLCNMFPD